MSTYGGTTQTPTPSKDPAFATPMFYDSSTQSDPSLAASAVSSRTDVVFFELINLQPMGPDPETMGMLRNILQSMRKCVYLARDAFTEQ